MTSAAPAHAAAIEATLREVVEVLAPIERAPQLVERFKTPPPQWWLGLSGPLATLASAIGGPRAGARAGFAIGAIGTALEEYAGPWLRDLLAARAAELDVALWRGYRARASTDSVIPSRAGYPTATLVSMTDWRAPANYHLPSDVPENLDYGTVVDATRLVFALCGVLAQRGAEGAAARS